MQMMEQVTNMSAIHTCR